MRRIRYVVAMSLDGYIAGPNGEYDWIVRDPEVDFGALWAEFDTLLMGRKTYEVGTKRLGKAAFAGMKVVVASRTLREEVGVRVMAELTREGMRSLRAEGGKDIWLMGGGEVFGALLEMGEVDGVEVNVVPVLLGGGVKLLPEIAGRVGLRLVGERVYGSGIVGLRYEVVG